MRAFAIDAYRGYESGRLRELPEPTVGADDVLVEVHAASVNPVDLKIAKGDLRLVTPFRFPLTLGNDCAGVVRGVGSSVSRFAVGDEIYARTRDDRIGCFAERVAIDASACARKPAKLTMVEAASLPLVSLTAHQALLDRAKLGAGQKVLIHAGSGGVGSIAIQLAKSVGAVVATTTSTKNVEMVKALGPDLVIDYKKEDFVEKVRDFDVVFDTLGGETQTRSLDVLKPGGMLVSVVGPPDPDFASESGANPIISLGMRAMSHAIRRHAKERGVVYSFLMMRANGDELARITRLVEAGAIHPVIDRTFSFDSVKEALHYVDSGRARGKVVVDMRAS